MKRWMPGVLLAVAVALPCSAVTVDVAPYAKRDDFETIKLSPNGDYYSAAVPLEGQSVLLVVQRSDNSVTGRINLGKNNYVQGVAAQLPRLGRIWQGRSARRHVPVGPHHAG